MVGIYLSQGRGFLLGLGTRVWTCSGNSWLYFSGIENCAISAQALKVGLYQLLGWGVVVTWHIIACSRGFNVAVSKLRNGEVLVELVQWCQKSL